MKKRTVAALMTVNQKGLINRFRNRKQPRHTYVYCGSRNIAKLFLENAEREGFAFGDGVLPTEREPDDLFAIKEDFTISYTGWAGHVMLKNAHSEASGNIVRIDYGKYISGSGDYVM